MSILQMIIQGIWVNDTSLRNIPNFTNEIISKLN